jgi:hypothetical protein
MQLQKLSLSSIVVGATALIAALLALSVTYAFAGSNNDYQNWSDSSNHQWQSDNQNLDNQNWSDESDSWNQDYMTQMLPGNEVPPVSSQTTGTAKVWDTDSSFEYSLDVWSDEDITMAHLHCAPPGTAGPIVVPLYMNMNGTNVDGNLVTSTFDEGDFATSSADCVKTIGYGIYDLQDLRKAMSEGNIYANVHSKQHPAGAARGQLTEMDTSDNNDTMGCTWNNSDWNNNGDNDLNWSSNSHWNSSNNWNDGNNWNSNDNQNNQDCRNSNHDWSSNSSDWNNSNSDNSNY